MSDANIRHRRPSRALTEYRCNENIGSPASYKPLVGVRRRKLYSLTPCDPKCHINCIPRGTIHTSRGEHVTSVHFTTGWWQPTAYEQRNPPSHRTKSRDNSISAGLLRIRPCEPDKSARHAGIYLNGPNLLRYTHEVISRRYFRRLTVRKYFLAFGNHDHLRTTCSKQFEQTNT